MKIETRKRLTFIIILKILSILAYIFIFRFAKTNIKLFFRGLYFDVVSGCGRIQHENYLRT